MKLRQARRLVLEKHLTVAEERRLPNDTGWQIRTAAGPILNAYDTGRIHWNGKSLALLNRPQSKFKKREMRAARKASAAPPTVVIAVKQNVFVNLERDRCDAGASPIIGVEPNRDEGTK
jgi:hypothetical protein